MKRLDLTDEQADLLLAVVAHATSVEQKRVERMKARWSGAHTPESIREAERLAEDLAELEESLS